MIFAEFFVKVILLYLQMITMFFQNPSQELIKGGKRWYITWNCVVF